jgi:2-polyprenyl-6-methoxyphenol hydroxylase-like FAD-dependent oxidoreductase
LASDERAQLDVLSLRLPVASQKAGFPVRVARELESALPEEQSAVMQAQPDELVQLEELSVPARRRAWPLRAQPQARWVELPRVLLELAREQPA